jgi:putrescine:ornithine antiporter
MAISTMSPNASEQFGKLVSLAAVTNIVPYITAISALLVIMYEKRVERNTFKLNLSAVLVAVFYSCYALYASGKDAVFGGMLVMMVGYLLYGFIANRFVAQQPIRVPRAVAAAASLMTLAVALLFIPAVGSAQTLARIQQSGAINIGFIVDQPPFSYESADRKPRGYAVEMCQQVADELKKRLAESSLSVNYLPTTPLRGLDMVQAGQIDVLCGAITETLKVREHASFSIPIYVTGVGALVREDASPALLRVLNGEVPHTGPTWRATVNSGLSNHTYAVHAGSTSDALVRERITTLGVIAKVITVRTYEEGIQMVADKRADAFFADRVILTTAVAQRRNGGALRVLDRRFTLEPVALLVQRGDEDFRLLVDTVLSRLYRSGGYASVYTRSFGEPSDTAKLLFQAYALP